MFTAGETRDYFFISSGFDSLTEEGVDTDGEAPVPVVEVDPAPGADVDAAAPADGVASGFGASAAGAGAGCAGAVLGAGALGAGAGAGATTFSSFLPAVRPIATKAAMMSERVMFYPFRVGMMRETVECGPWEVTYPSVMPIVHAPLISTLLQRPSTLAVAAGVEISHSSV